MLERFLFRAGCCRGVEDRRVRRERLWASVRDRRSVARKAAVTSGEGGSPKMKNLMKAPMRMTMESWPRRRPCVKERLGDVSQCPSSEGGDLRRLGLGGRRFYARHLSNSRFFTALRVGIWLFIDSKM